MISLVDQLSLLGLAWEIYMGRWGGPLSENWLNQQLVLQKKILSRMLELGMTPVLPSFSGNVPAALKTIFPTANITRLGDWNTVDGDPRWCCTYLLNPSDPLFVEIGEAFIRMQIKEYGDVTDIYNCDTFNENSPPTNDPTYISSLGAAVFKAMSNGDKDAVWLMQGWLFYSESTFWKPPQMKALLHSVPVGKMIVLDLFADVKPIWATSSQFYGTPYVWCLLHNFGGNIEMYGTLDAISSGPVDARISKNSTMVGVGMCMEGIEQNPVVYELMSETAFREEKVQVLEWLKTYTHRRYDWDPSTNSVSQPSNRNNTHTYSLKTGTMLSKLANKVYLDAVKAFRRKDVKALNFHGQKFIQLIKDIDVLVASDDNFLLGTWLESAKMLAKNPSEMRQYEWNARTQVTMWFDTTATNQSQLHDYANKFWSGLLEGYYLPRASSYFNHLLKSLEKNESFNIVEWRKQWISFSNKWQQGVELYPAKAKGDFLAIAKALFEKYFS
ncbi:Detected protein of confused Function [Hibiscus syriacus]|uniref:Detected protein of confused Function n=1 Tax=Hibiscus syriacus TaxID=106335 RepID=A0A6A2Y643_HIBSY|nr:Detected protein of confused Function [Hibiscus syriacus]